MLLLLLMLLLLHLLTWLSTLRNLLRLLLLTLGRDSFVCVDQRLVIEVEHDTATRSLLCRCALRHTVHPQRLAINLNRHLSHFAAVLFKYMLHIVLDFRSRLLRILLLLPLPRLRFITVPNGLLLRLLVDWLRAVVLLLLLLPDNCLLDTLMLLLLLLGHWASESGHCSLWRCSLHCYWRPRVLNGHDSDWLPLSDHHFLPILQQQHPGLPTVSRPHNLVSNPRLHVRMLHHNTMLLLLRVMLNILLLVYHHPLLLLGRVLNVLSLLLVLHIMLLLWWMWMRRRLLLHIMHSLLCLWVLYLMGRLVVVLHNHGLLLVLNRLLRVLVHDLVVAVVLVGRRLLLVLLLLLVLHRLGRRLRLRGRSGCRLRRVRRCRPRRRRVLRRRGLRRRLHVHQLSLRRRGIHGARSLSSSPTVQRKCMRRGTLRSIWLRAAPRVVERPAVKDRASEQHSQCKRHSTNSRWRR